MLVIGVKLLLAPAFVIGASLAARRFGMLIGGIVGGLPVVAGPILLAFALDHGKSFAAEAAVGTLLGLISLTTFAVVYARSARRVPWSLCLAAGWTAFMTATAVLSALDVGPVAALGAACATFVAALRLLPPNPPSSAPGAAAVPASPSWDLAARAASALLLVVVLTSAAAALGPSLSGLLAPFPIVASILAAFTHAQYGVAATRRILRGLVLGFFAFALFCFAVAEAVERLGIAAAFGVAALVALTAQALLLGGISVSRSAAR